MSSAWLNLAYLTASMLFIVAFIQLVRGGGRTGVSSGVAGVLSELDRAVRPSVQHVVEAKHSVKKQEEGIGGD